MAKRKRSIRPEFIFGALIIGIIIFASVMSWWQTHSAIGWAIIVLLLAAFSFSLYRFPEFRRWILKKGKSTTEKLITDGGEPPREQVPGHIYRAVMARARGRCENPDCNSTVRPQIHHINQNNTDSADQRNLIALCPNCHTEVHRTNKFSFQQLRNFVHISYTRQKQGGA